MNLEHIFISQIFAIAFALVSLFLISLPFVLSRNIFEGMVLGYMATGALVSVLWIL